MHLSHHYDVEIVSRLRKHMLNSSTTAGPRRSHDSSGPVEVNCDLLPKRSRRVLTMVEDGAGTQYRRACPFACFYDPVKPKIVGEQKTLKSDSLPRPAAVYPISKE